MTAVSPDDVWMLSQCLADGTWAERLDGTERIMVASGTDFPEGIDLGSLWSPDGSMLIVTGGIRSIWLIKMSELGSNHTVLHGDTLMPHFAPTWSPDGQSLAAEHLEEGVSLSILYLDGTSRNLLYETDVNWQPKAFESCEPAWSPDGREIAYLVRPEAEGDMDVRVARRQIWAVNVATGAKRLLLASDGFLTGPSWSPDGERMAVIIAHGVAIWNLSAGHFQIAVTLEGASGLPLWSPDGQSIAVNSDEGVYVIRVADGGVRRITDRVSWLDQWASDGLSLVAFTDGGTTVRFIPVE